MKTINIAIASFFCVCIMILAGCGRSDSTSSSAYDVVVSEGNASITTPNGGALLDQNTELTTGVQGFTVKNVYIVDGNDEKISSREIALNTNFSIVYEGVKNYTLKDGMAFPNLSLQVIDNDQTIIKSETDLLAYHSSGLSEQDASVLRATVAITDPMRPGKYICSVQVVDKNNSNAAILSTWEFEVK